MLKRLSGAVLVSAGELGAEAPEARRVRYAVMNGSEVMRHGECAVTDLRRMGGWDMRASFFSRSGYFERTHAQTENRRVATIVARRFIDDEMLFNEPYRLRMGIRLTGEHEVTLKLMAAAEADCLRLEDTLPLDTHPVSLATLEEAAIAGLIAKATAEPVLALFARGDRFLSFVAENGEVRQRRMENIVAGDPVSAEEAIRRVESMVLAASGGDAKEVALRVYLGDLRPLVAQGAPARDYASREVEKRMAALIRGGDALAEPELYGLRFASHGWNFLEDEQARRAYAWQMALPVASILGVGALVFGLLFAFEVAQNSGLGAQVAGERQRLLAEQESLSKRVPQGKDLERFKDLTDLLKRRSDQVRADRLLSWVSQELPSGVIIASLQLYAKGDTPPEAQQVAAKDVKGLDLLSRLIGASGQENAAQPAATNKAGPADAPDVYVVRLDLSIPGAYDAVEAQAANVIRRLSAKMAFSRSYLDYDAAKNRARLVSELSVRAEDFR